MLRNVFTHFLPSLVEPAELSGGTAVVIDVLRAGTTICHALAAGAQAVIPCAEVVEARQLAANLDGQECVLGGERGGQPIDGFDLGNSPLEYTEEFVGGKTVVFTTTNGTRALVRCAEADRILVGAFNNLGAVVERLMQGTSPVHLVCAGTNGQITGEDVLCAGAMAEFLSRKTELFDCGNDQTSIAIDFYLFNCDMLILETLRDSLGGRNLRDLGMEADIQRAAELNRFPIVPVYSPQTGRVTPDE